MSIIEEIDSLEDNGLWKSALLTLAEGMEKKPDVKKAYRLLFICWYALLEWGQLELNEDAESEVFEEGLRKITDTILRDYMNVPEINFYLGYMFSIASYFYSDDDAFWEEKTSQMLDFAAYAKPENVIFQMVNLGNKNIQSDEYHRNCELARSEVKKMYSGKGEFNRYFRQVLTR